MDFDFFPPRGSGRWPSRHVTLGWPWNRSSRIFRYYTYNDEDDDGNNGYLRNNVDLPITLATDNNSSDFSGDPKIEKVATKPQENAVAHHTDKFDQVEHGDLIVRRGQPFRMVLTFNKTFRSDAHSIKFSFMIGSRPLPGKGTLVSFTLDSNTSNDWTANIQQSTGRDVEISVTTGVDCIVGEWRMTIDVLFKDGRESSRYIHKKPVYVLFNPWCKEDSVYFPDEDKLSEYILNDSGCIFAGNFRQISATPWFFGQFEEGVLDAAIYCLARACNFRYGKTMSDPVRVSRALSKIINSNDDDGVLVGKWSEPYAGGKAPWSWTGSVAILRQFMNTKAPVKFGQCFVFSGVLTTVCRALGVPCRSVTNYCSAHDTDASITIDQHWDINGNNDGTIEIMDRDSIWNFHCWNDVWMQRPDLPGGHYDGWQVVDSTPQETSNGVFQCGPTSLTAVLNGKCDLMYDAPFVFAEVNADIVHWGRQANGEWVVTKIDKSGIGKMISTKVPDGQPMPNCLSDCLSIREDITDQYKYKDESERERLAVISASSSALNNRNVYGNGPNEITCELVPQDNILIGSGFTVSVILANTGTFQRTVVGQLSCHSITYTGIRVQNIKTVNLQATIAPKREQLLTMPVSADEYLGHVTENAALKICFAGRVEETQQILTMKDDFRLRIPDLLIKVLTEVPRVGSVLKCRVYLNNPLQSRNLTNCSLEVEGPGIKDSKSFRIGTVHAGRDFTGILDLTPIKPGLRQIYVVFECDQLHDVKGVTEVFVYAKGSTVYMG